MTLHMKPRFIKKSTESISLKNTILFHTLKGALTSKPIRSHKGLYDSSQFRTFCRSPEMHVKSNEAQTTEHPEAVSKVSRVEVSGEKGSPLM